MGFAPRYNTLTTSTSQTANNVVNGGGGASVQHLDLADRLGRRQGGGHLPEGLDGGPAGHRPRRALGIRRQLQALPGAISEYKWKAGLHVRDWRYVVRIANLATGQRHGRLHQLGAGRHRRLHRSGDREDPQPSRCLPPGALHEPHDQALPRTSSGTTACNASSTVNLTTIRRTDGGDDRGVIQHFDNYDGIPIKICDQILSTEATLT
jgi:hypothetical protein